MIAENGTLASYVSSLLDDGKRCEDVEDLLCSKGHDETFVRSFVAEVAKLRYAKRRTQGLTLILIGAVICFASCVLTIMTSYSHSAFPWILYGLTSLGIIVIFAGFTKVF